METDSWLLPKAGGDRLRQLDRSILAKVAQDDTGTQDAVISLIRVRIRPLFPFMVP
jgi:hypothetical protein